MKDDLEMDIQERAWCEVRHRFSEDVLLLYPRYDINVCAECMEKALAIISNTCPNCREDRRGKGSLVYMGRAFCNESCFGKWKDQVNKAHNTGSRK